MTTAPPTRPSTRLVSLDVLRGITIAFMILVNNNGDWHYAYWALKHAEWNGFTPTDLVFPTFLFLVGTSTVFSIESRLARGATRLSILGHSLRRSVILFALGLLVNGFPFFTLGTFRIYGVLQRIAICFLVGSAIYLYQRRMKPTALLIVALLLGYWILMRWVPVPGLGMPGRDIPFLDRDANMVAWLDRHILPGHLYEGVRDPEGLLSDIPALATTLLGVLTGIFLRSPQSTRRKATLLLFAGLGLLLLGAGWNHWFPINKKLWTSSYVLFSAGWTLLPLTLCYWAVEIKGWRRGWTWFWLVFGTNAITAYVFSELLASGIAAISVPFGQARVNLQQYIFLRIFAPIGYLSFASLLYSIAFVLVCFVPVAILYRRKIFIKV